MDRPREPLPTRVEDTPELPTEYDGALEAGLDALSLTLSPAARAAIDGHVAPAPGLDRGDQPDRDPRSGGGRDRARGRQPERRGRPARARHRPVHRPRAPAAAIPGLPIAAVLPAARALLLEPVAKKAGFLSVVAAATGLAATVEAAPVRAEALAADGRHRGRWPGVTVRAVASLAELVELAFPLLEPGGCLVAWKRGDLDAELAAAERAIDALGGGSIEVRPVAVDGLDGHRLSSPRRAAGSRPDIRATPARASGGHGERHAARFDGVRIVVVSDIHSNLLALDAVLAKVGAVDAIWHLGDVVGYGPEPDGVVDRLKTLGAIGVRGNHDAAATGGSEIDWFNPEAKAAMEWTRTAISESTREWLAALPAAPARIGLHARPRQSARPDLGVRHVGGARPGRPVGDLDRARAPRSHPRPDRVHDGRRTDAHARPARRQHGRPRGGPLLPQPGLGRPAARRRPAGELHGPRQRGRDRDVGAGAPTTSRPSVRRCVPRAFRLRLADRLRVGA